MPNFKKNPKAMGSPYKMKGNPMQRNFGIGSPLHDTLPEVEVSGGKGGKSRAQRDYEKRLDKLAAQEVARKGPSGTPTEDYKNVYANLSDAEKAKYKAKAQSRAQKL